MKEYEFGTFAVLAVTLLDNNLFKNGDYFYEEMFLKAKDRLSEAAKQATLDSAGRARYTLNFAIYSREYAQLKGKLPWLKKVNRKIYLPTTSAYRQIYVIDKRFNTPDIPEFPYSLNSVDAIENYLKVVLGKSFFYTLYPEKSSYYQAEQNQDMSM